MKRLALAISVLVSSLSACAPKVSGPERRDARAAHIVEVRADFDPLDSNVTIVRFLLTTSTRYKVLELPARQEVWIDVDGGVPKVKVSEAGGFVDRITYTTATHDDGTPLGRVMLHLVDPTYGLLSTRGNGTGRVGEIRIGPNRESGHPEAPPRLRKTLGDTPGETE